MLTTRHLFTALRFITRHHSSTQPVTKRHALLTRHFSPSRSIPRANPAQVTPLRSLLPMHNVAPRDSSPGHDNRSHQIADHLLDAITFRFAPLLDRIATRHTACQSSIARQYTASPAVSLLAARSQPNSTLQLVPCRHGITLPYNSSHHSGSVISARLNPCMHDTSKHCASTAVLGGISLHDIS